MDFATIANSVVTSILAPYLLKVGEGVASGAGASIWKAIQEKLHSDPDTKGALNRLEEKPADCKRQKAVADIVEEKMEKDSVFAEQMRKAVQSSGDGTTQIANIIADTTGDINIGMYGNIIGEIHNNSDNSEQRNPRRK